MPKSNYKVLVCEGGDQVGKGDAILTFSVNMTNMNIPVTYSSFPIYASPFGTVIRLFLTGKLKQFDFEKEKELKIMMAFFALNRLEFMEILLSHPESKETLILLDRSPFSNAVTIAYGLASEYLHDEKKLNEFIDYAMKLDSFMIKKMNLTNCVVQLVSEDMWNNKRRDNKDIYEKKDAQEAADRIYDMYAKRIGDGWKKILTKTKKGWRDREEIFNDIYTFTLERNNKIVNQGRRSILKYRYEIGIEEVLQNIYKWVVYPEGLVNNYLKALHSNEKEKMYEYGVEVGLAVGRTCKAIRIKNSGVKRAMKQITTELPEIYDVLSVLIAPRFADKFRKAINE